MSAFSTVSQIWGGGGAGSRAGRGQASSACTSSLTHPPNLTCVLIPAPRHSTVDDPECAAAGSRAGPVAMTTPSLDHVHPHFYLQLHLQPIPTSVSILTSTLNPHPPPHHWFSPEPFPPPPKAISLPLPSFTQPLQHGGVPYSESACSSYSAQTRPCPLRPALLEPPGYPRS